MKQINVLFTLYSLTAFIIIVERLSPTTQILLPPFNFIRLHELIQTNIFIATTIVISFFLLKEITNNFQRLKDRSSGILVAFFVLGVYLYGAGEGWHEVASFTLNTYCNIHKVTGNLCGGLFINDFYAGNIIFFIGGLLMNISLMILATKQPMKQFSKKDITILLINSVVYAFTWFAYAAFDTVLVGLFFAAMLMIVSLGFFLKIKRRWREYPYITYSALAYTLATIATIPFKLY